MINASERRQRCLSHDIELKNVLSYLTYLLTLRFFLFFLYTLIYDESERSWNSAKNWMSTELCLLERIKSDKQFV